MSQQLAPSASPEATSGQDDPHYDAGAEFDRQVAVLVDKGYPALAGLGSDGFAALVALLRAQAVARAASMSPPTRSTVPFVLVVSGRVAAPSATIELTELGGRPGFLSKDTADIDRFEPIDGIGVPAADAYLVFDVDRGTETLNISPDDAMVILTGQGRTPLTVDEGIAFVTLFPDSLEKNNCFQLAGSRCGDRRVPGLWISNRRPKLGFCWAGNVHTWLGAASCGARSA